MSQPETWVLLRGLMRDARHWGDFPQQLGKALPEVRLCLPDFPGNGARHLETSLSSVPAMAEWLRAELRRQGIAPPYRVFALSLGAMVTVAWADIHPREIDRAVLVNTSLRPFSPIHHRLRPSAWPLLLRMALGQASPRVAEQTILRLTSQHHASSGALLAQWEQWHRARPVSRTNALRQLIAAARYHAPRQAPRVPLLLLNGGGDQLVSPACSKALAAAWNCPLVQHPSAGHDLPLDDPAWVVAQLEAWRRSPIKNPA